MYAKLSIMSNFLLGTILFIPRASLALASPVTIFPRVSNLPDLDSIPLLVDTSAILAPTSTPFIHLGDGPQVTPVSTATNPSKPEGWTPRYTLIVVIVVCSTLVIIMGLFVVFYIARRNKRRLLEEVAARNEKAAMVAKATGSVKNMRSLRPMITADPSRGTITRTVVPPKEAVGTVRGVNAKVEGAMKRSTVGAVKRSLGRPNVAGTISRASSTVGATRPPRPEYSLSRTAIAEGQAIRNSALSAVALKESEEKEVVVVLAPGAPAPVEKERMQWTGTWNRNMGMSVPGPALSRSEYMV